MRLLIIIIKIYIIKTIKSIFTNIFHNFKYLYLYLPDNFSSGFYVELYGLPGDE